MRRKIQLMVIVAFVTAFAVINHGCSGPEESVEILSFDLEDPKLKERLGEDDGFALAILYGADIHGSLETCG